MLVGDYPAGRRSGRPGNLAEDQVHAPENLEPGARPTELRLAGGVAGAIQQSLRTSAGQRSPQAKGTDGEAFITNNPLLPKDYYNPPGLDDFVVKMNEGVEYSLLECPGRYTVQVAHFTGQVIIDQARSRPSATVEKTWRAGWPRPPTRPIA